MPLLAVDGAQDGSAAPNHPADLSGRRGTTGHRATLDYHRCSYRPDRKNTARSGAGRCIRYGRTTTQRVAGCSVRMVVNEVTTARRTRDRRAPGFMASPIEPRCILILSDKPILTSRFGRIVDNLHHGRLARRTTGRARTSEAGSLNQKSITDIAAILNLSGRIAVAGGKIRSYIDGMETVRRYRILLLSPTDDQ